ncbi:hypothetical protein H4R19_004918 [Coemansia spiralis]|nr:hypothetical protein H4R19_004918 [Coemansia spiralis]
MSKLAAQILRRSGAVPTLTFEAKPKSLFELLNVQRLNAYKFKAMPDFWFDKGFENCYFEVHRVKYRQYKGEPSHGKAWGIEYWNGAPMSEHPKEIRGGHKFSWRPYESPAASGISYSRTQARTVERRRLTRLLGFYKHAGVNEPADKKPVVNAS